MMRLWKDEKKAIIKTHICVKAQETDPYGVVNNSQYYHYFETGIYAFCAARHLPWQQFICETSLYKASCKYIHFLQFNDKAIVSTSIQCINKADQLIYFSQLMMHDPTNKLIAKAAFSYRIHHKEELSDDDHCRIY